MKPQVQTQQSPRVHRKDYRPASHRIDAVDLRFELDPEQTRVLARLEARRNPEASDGTEPLVLQGEKLELVAVRLDGRELAPGEYERSDETLTIRGVPERFVLETEVRIHPAANKALSGLFLSGGVLCTQCEAQGFRRITYFLDRPDVMARYTVTLTADKQRYPVLLSNGNRVETRDLDGGRHLVRWEDPYPKPSYLFAVVAGDLRSLAGDYTTRSGREVRCEIWVEPWNADKCEHALASLHQAMRWDEEVFGLAYDLDLYMVVAVNDFNMGAMENKGLNVFNSKFVLARPDSATDDDYEGIQGVIGHEYFHNWTGNRVTCRDWFQLTLKEGLTVFRDQQFTADMTSAAVKRIQDTLVLRTYQFAEDSGPMAHPVRPESYVEMNNFYTVTVYNKGAEVVRMYHTLLGQEGFRRGMDLYFERHDGSAVTCDDFRAAMADANGRDLAQFARWYEQAGTPLVEVSGHHDAAARTYALTLRQSYPALAEQAESTPAEPLHVPVVVGLIGPDGSDLSVTLAGSGTRATEHLLELREAEQTFAFSDVDVRPVPSVLRGFSAPARLRLERTREELAFLMAHDSDSFNRWDAGQVLARELLLELVAAWGAGGEPRLDPLFVEAWGKVLTDPLLDGSLKSLALGLPAEKLLGQEMSVVDVEGIHGARRFALRELARAHRGELERVCEANAADGPYRNDKVSIDRRRIRNRALAVLSCLEEPEVTAIVMRQFREADNMTERQAALAMLMGLDVPERAEALEAFRDAWVHDPLVMDKWFALQAGSSLPDTVERVRGLTRHPDFRLDNPNRARALLGTFGQANQLRFHTADGSGYELLADHVLELDRLNPQVAARLVSSFNPWKRFDAARQALMMTQLERIAAAPELSKDVREIVSRSLAS